MVWLDHPEPALWERLALRPASGRGKVRYIRQPIVFDLIVICRQTVSQRALAQQLQTFRKVVATESNICEEFLKVGSSAQSGSNNDSLTRSINIIMPLQTYCGFNISTNFVKYRWPSSRFKTILFQAKPADSNHAYNRHFYHSFLMQKSFSKYDYEIENSSLNMSFIWRDIIL